MPAESLPDVAATAEATSLFPAILESLPAPAGAFTIRDGEPVAIWLNAAAVAAGFAEPALGLVPEDAALWLAACVAAERQGTIRFACRMQHGERVRVAIAPLVEALACFSFALEGPAPDAIDRQLAHLVEIGAIGVLLFDPTGCVVYANAMVANLIGRPQDQLTGRTYRDLPPRLGLKGQVLPEEDHPFFAARAHDGWHGGYIRLQRDNGDADTIVLERCHALRGPSGTVAAVAYTLTDVTDFTRQQEALKQSVARYQRLLDVAREGVFELAPDGRVLSANHAFARLFGYDDIARFLAEFNSEDPAAARQRAMLLAAVSGEEAIADRELCLDDRGEAPVWVSLAARRVLDDAGAVCRIEGTALDISARKRSEDELRRQNAYLHVLHETALSLMEEREPAEMMNAILQRAVELTDTQHGFVYVRDPRDEDALALGAAQGVFERLRMQRIHRGEGLAGAVWVSGRPNLVVAYDAWPGRASWFPFGAISSVAGVPLSVGGECVGVLGVAREVGAPPLNENEITLLERFAPLAALALENAALYRRLGERLSRTQTLTRLNQLISATLDMRSVLDEITTAAARLMEVPFASFWLVNEAKQCIELRAYSNVALGSTFPEPVRDLSAGGAIGWIVRERRPRDLALDDDASIERVRAWQNAHSLSHFYGLPVAQGERVLGVLALYGERPFVLQEETEELLQSLAAQAAVAIHNAGLYEQLGVANAQLMNWVGELERRSEQIHLLSQMGELLQSCLTAEEAYAVLGEALEQIFPDAACTLYVLNASRTYAEALVSTDDRAGGSTIFRPDECWALRRGRIHLVRSARTALRCHHTPATEALYVCVPMMAQGEATGVLHVRFTGGDAAYDAGVIEAKQRLAQTVAEQTALALANLRLRETLRDQAIRDQLTGLYNRRYMEESLVREVHRAARAGTGLGVLMLDIDHFKRFNDEYGHPAGDLLLREVCVYLQEHVRGEDIACRYGGEEITLILPDVTTEEACARAEELRHGVHAVRVQHRGETLGGVTISIGVATLPRHGSTAEALLQAADAALYRAKTLGRDRVVVAES